MAARDYRGIMVFYVDFMFVLYQLYAGFMRIGICIYISYTRCFFQGIRKNIRTGSIAGVRPSIRKLPPVSGSALPPSGTVFARRLASEVDFAIGAEASDSLSGTCLSTAYAGRV